MQSASGSVIMEDALDMREYGIIQLGTKQKRNMWSTLVVTLIIFLIFAIMVSSILYITLVPKKEGFDPIKRVSYVRRPICERICNVYTDPCRNRQWQYAGGSSTCNGIATRYPSLKDKCMLTCQMNRFHK